ncbi:hypothetical protein A3K73_08055 [Candidatus Pacearchaeota archaeon RBG_13_36_9]|nr:MAG: hypothetical protein A3K73_08055 [Candidatus Pacearchaeota archaeon RBG_13_36_9]
MKIQTFSIIAGTTACNASCPYCISKMTPKQGINLERLGVNWRNFEKACRLAQISGVTTVLITGKGEPTLYPRQITEFLEKLKPFNFPLTELQTNALALGKEFEKYQKYLKKWYELGLTMVAISIVHYNKEKNKEIFTPNRDYIDLDDIIEKLHRIGFSVRLSCTLAKGYVDSVEEIKKMIEYSKKLAVDQLSIRKLAKPLHAENKEVFEWANNHLTEEESISEIKDFLEKEGNRIMTLEHGAAVYDIYGQNLCLTDALTLKPESDTLRQIIFFPNGHLKFDWQYPGATLI